MPNKISLGFYSKNIVKVFIILIISLFIGITYFSLKQYAEDFKKTVLKQSDVLTNEWDKTVLVYTHILKNNFLPAIRNELKHSNIYNQRELLSKFKADFSFTNTIENIFLLDPELNISSYAKKTSQISSDNISLADRPYIIESKKFPNEIQFGEPVLGKVSKVMTLPIAVALQENSKIMGYLVLSLNLENLTAEINKNKMAESLEKISFAATSYPNDSLQVNLTHLINSSFSCFIELLLNSFHKYKHIVVEINLDSLEMVSFIYNSQSITQDFLTNYLADILLLLLISFLSLITYRLYLKKVLNPIYEFHVGGIEVIESYNKFMPSPINTQLFQPRAEVGDMLGIITICKNLINRIALYDGLFKQRDEAINLVFNVSNIITGHFLAKSKQLNEVLQDLKDEFDSNDSASFCSELSDYFQEIYQINNSKNELLNLYSSTIKDILQGLDKGKEEIKLLDILSQLINEQKDLKLCINLSNFNSSNFTDLQLIYKSFLYKSVVCIIEYIKSYYETSQNNPIELQVITEYSKEKNITINFLVHATKTGRNNITKINELHLLKAKIYSLINCSLITEVLNTKHHMISIVFFNAEIR